MFAVIHKATLMAIHEKWRSNGKAHQVYGRVQKLVQQVVQDRRWRVSKSKFESVWVDTGAAKAVGREGRIVMAPLWAARHFARDKAGPQIEIYTPMGQGGEKARLVQDGVSLRCRRGGRSTRGTARL